MAPRPITEPDRDELKRISVELNVKDWRRIQRRLKLLKKNGKNGASLSGVIRELIQDHLN